MVAAEHEWHVPGRARVGNERRHPCARPHDLREVARAEGRRPLSPRERATPHRPSRRTRGRAKPPAPAAPHNGSPKGPCRPRAGPRRGRARPRSRRPDGRSSFRSRRKARLAALGEVAQLVEHTAENRGVAGSSPALAIGIRFPRTENPRISALGLFGVSLPASRAAPALAETRRVRPRAREACLAIPVRGRWIADRVARDCLGQHRGLASVDRDLVGAEGVLVEDQLARRGIGIGLADLREVARELEAKLDPAPAREPDRGDLGLARR